MGQTGNRDDFVHRAIQFAEDEARRRILEDLGPAAVIDEKRLHLVVAASLQVMIEFTQHVGATKAPNDDFWTAPAWMQRAEEAGRIASLSYQGKMDAPDKERSAVSDSLLQMTHDEAVRRIVRDFAFLPPLNEERLLAAVHDAFGPVHVEFIADSQHGNTFEAPHWDRAPWEAKAKEAGKSAARKYLGDED
jgi:hypothetical protein